MSSMRDQFEKVGLTGSGEPQQKRCKCGKPIKNPKFDQCYDCSQKKTVVSFEKQDWRNDYLKDGYFSSDGCLQESLLTDVANNIALSFSNAYPKLKNHQLRRFYQHARAAENKLNMTHDWPCVNVDIKKLKPFVAEAKGKQKIPDVFYDFISINIDRINDEKSFIHGFLEHFQAVLAYFTYYKPKD